MKLIQRIVGLSCLLGLASALQAQQICSPNIKASTPTSDFSETVSGTITHANTGLMWKRCAEGQTWTGSACSGSATQMDWATALAAAKTQFAGFSDWRVPNIKELESIVESRCVSPSMNKDIFPDAPTTSFLSSTTVASNPYSPPGVYNPNYVWSIEQYTGEAAVYLKSGDFGVRLVRLGTPPTDFDALNSAPRCSLTASKSNVVDGESTTLTASCTATDVTSYQWKGGACEGQTGSTCTDTPSASTTYTVTGRSGTQDYPASVTVSFTACTFSLNAASVSFGVAASESNTVKLTSNCTRPWTAGVSADAQSWITNLAPVEGSGKTSYDISYRVSENTNPASRNGTLTIAGQTFTVLQRGTLGTPPVCTLKADKPTVLPNESATLTASCDVAATSYVWTGGTCPTDNKGATCVVSPTGATEYTVAGVSAAGTGPVSATVTVKPQGATRFTLNADGTVTDPSTKLLWKRCAEGQTWTGSDCSGTAVTYSWTTALGLKGDSFAGKSWRLPSKDELNALVEASSSPAIDTTAFPSAPVSTFWTASTDNTDPANAWVVDFGTGKTYATAKEGLFDGYKARLVSGGQAAAPVCTLSASPTTVTAGGTSNLTASCTGATSYQWTGGTCAGLAGTTCTVTPSDTTTYTVVGSNAGLSGSASVQVIVTAAAPCSYTLGNTSATFGAGGGTGTVIVTKTSTACASWTATSNTFWINVDAFASATVSGSVAYSIAANTSTNSRTGTLTIAGQTFAVTQAGQSAPTPPTCTLSASPAVIAAGGSSILNASCPGATTYTWSDSTCSTTSSTCTVRPTGATTYTVVGNNSIGLSNPVQVTVRIAAPSKIYTDNGDGTVTDPTTMLTWKRCAEGQTWTGSDCSGTATAYTWTAAVGLNGGGFAGKSWRLPSKDELSGLVDLNFSPTITATANAVDVVTGICFDGAHLDCSFVQDIKEA
jgi:hypothetical protein